MSVDHFEITEDDADEIVRRVTDEDGVAPLKGKEEALLKVLIEAQRRHDEALEIDTWRREHPKAVKKLRKALQTALEAVEETDVNFAIDDPELDESYINPDSRHDLRGMLRRALSQLEENDEDVPVSDDLHSLLDRHDSNGKIPRKVRSHPDGISSVGIRDIVECLYNFWSLETDLPFSDDFYKPLDDDGNEAELKPKGLAAKLVYETARLIDPGYTADACSNAMRPR